MWIKQAIGYSSSKFTSRCKIRLQIRSYSSVSPRSSFLQPVNDSIRKNNEVDWDKLGFSIVETDHMYMMKCTLGEKFRDGKLIQYGNIKLNPSAGVLNYGQGLYEGLKAYRKKDGNGFLLFRPQENAARMQLGADRMCMPSPSIDQFVDAVKQTVIANKRWVPPSGKGALYVRPLLIGSGPILGLAPAPEYTFLVYSSPVGLYFKEGLAPIELLLQDEVHRSCPGGTGGIKTITNYAPVLKAQIEAKSKGYADVLYVDSVDNIYLEEASSCNIFMVKDDVIATPKMRGTILNGVTRRSIIDIARDFGYKVEERLVSIEDIKNAEEVFCTGTAVVVAPVGGVTFQGQRFRYKIGVDTVAQRLYKTLTDIQTGTVEDKRGWVVDIDYDSTSRVLQYALCA